MIAESEIVITVAGNDSNPIFEELMAKHNMIKIRFIYQLMIQQSLKLGIASLIHSTKLYTYEKIGQIQYNN